MTVAYQVRIYDTSGTIQAVMGLENDVRSLVIEHRVNYVSTLTLGLYGLSSVVQYFIKDAIVVIMRRVPEANIDWYPEFVGFHRTPQKQITSANNRIFTSYCRSLLDLIRRSSIRYYADTVGSAKGPAAADNVIKAYVRENAGSLATVANGRVVAHVYTGLAVAADTSAAASYEGAHAWENLLDAVRTIGEPAKVDFNVVWGGIGSPATFTFQTYYPQLGTDRRAGTAAPMIFAPNLANMVEPSHTIQTTEEVSSALVLGPGEGPLRDTTLRLSTHINDSPWNLIEQDINASGEDRTVALNAIGDELLYNKRPALSFSFRTLQTAQSAYGKHYFLGDLVTGTFDDVSADVKIRAVTLRLEGANEIIGLELEEVPA